MTLTIDNFRKKWDEISYHPSAYVRIDECHPLNIYIGYEQNREKCMLIINTKHFPEIKSSKSIIVQNNEKSPDNWVLSFRLINKSNIDVFTFFCWDMIESTRNSSNKAADQILNRYLRWQSLLENGKTGILSISAQRGLIGELTFLSKLLSLKPAIEAVRSWMGPDASDRDFLLSKSWAEIKTKSYSSDTIKVSSIEQLDTSEKGYLVVYSIEKTSLEDQKGFCLVDIVNSVRSLLFADQYSLSIFENKLLLCGYFDDDEYRKYMFRIDNGVSYEVNEEFPRLRRSEVAHQIINATYTLSLSAIISYLVEGDQLWM